MVVASLTIGGAVGVLLSGAFLWWEIGRYAAPQVPVTLFDERKLLAGYTVGLFVGVPLAVAFVLFADSAANGALPGAALFLGLLVAGTELAQLFLARTVYWGRGAALPFYALAFRAGIGAILALAVVSAYLGTTAAPTVLGTVAAAVEALAVVALEVAGGLLSRRDASSGAVRVGGPLAGGLFALVAFFLIGLGPLVGPAGAVAAPLVVLGGATLAYRGRRAVLAAVPAPGAPRGPPSGDRPLPYGRTELPASEESAPDRRAP
ncbi:MAG TPA: hypothetical protein VMH49_06090 [Thermoplasmata archaeon]|nr:hypothetical protein [Thermoplasmata archaeon]